MKDEMKAVVLKKYGPAENLKIISVKKPVIKDDEILIEIKASAVTDSDIYVRASNVPMPNVIFLRLMMGIFRPRRKVQGQVFSGIVKSIGSKITRFKPGDKVYGLSGFNLGCHAEYLSIKEYSSGFGCISKMPTNITYEEATSAAYGGLLALQCLDSGLSNNVKKVIIYGASGTSGTIAVQYAKSLGLHITAVCSSRNFKLVKSLGADEVVDYNKTNSLKDIDSYDLLLDSVGITKTSDLKKFCIKNIRKSGIYVSISNGNLKLDSHVLDKLAVLIKSKKIKPILDKIYNLENIVEAHKYVEKGHKTGGVAIRI